MSLKIFVDHAQNRLQKHRIAVTVAGTEWYAGSSDSIWFDVVTRCLMIRPFCLTPEWSTTSTGNYSRWGIADFALPGTGWYTKSDKQAGQNRIANQVAMASSAISTATLNANQGMWVSFFNFNEGDKEGVTFECGWSNVGNGTVGVSLRFYAGGRVEVWKDGTMLETGNVNGSGSRNNANKYVNILLLPMRKRELLIYNHSGGGGFVHLFDDIAEDAVAPVITSASKFWFKAIINPDVEIAPLKFPTSGWIVSPTIQFADVPDNTRSVETVWALGNPLFAGNDAILYADKSYHGAGGAESISDVRFVEDTAITTTFAPDGVKRKCRLRCQINGNGLSTPYLYGIHRPP